MRKFHACFSNQRTAKKLQHYPVLRMVTYNVNVYVKVKDVKEIEDIRQNSGFTVLEIVSKINDHSLNCSLAKMLPNLRMIYICNMQIGYNGRLDFSRNCSLLEKATILNNNCDMTLDQRNSYQRFVQLLSHC